MTDNPIKPGVSAEKTVVVDDTMTAKHLGSGALAVFATPAMVALMEGTAVLAIDPLLPEGQASVGTALNIRHLAATPLGGKVRARAEVTAVDGRQVQFRVQVWDETELVGEGEHTRFIIDRARFSQRVAAKKTKPAG